jgi:Zn-dependent protease/CBS domain-containing protein
MKGTLSLGSYAGIPVKLHWSFVLLMLFVVYLGKTTHASWPEILILELFVFILFFCVILHEFGHALMAKRFGIKTRDIILSPVGGIARLENLPKQPHKEIWIAFSGPAVNILIALISLVILIVMGADLHWSMRMDLTQMDRPETFIKNIFLINILLFFFNLIPAFPMDGGRILRAGIALKVNRVKATQIATSIGLFLSIIFIVYGLYVQHYLLVVIGGFVSLLGGSENRSVKYEYFMEHTMLKDISITGFPKIPVGTTVEDAFPLFEKSGFNALPVLNEASEIIGLIYKAHFLKQRMSGLKGNVEDFLLPAYTMLEGSISLLEMTSLMNETGYLLVGHYNEQGQLAIIDRAWLQKMIDAGKHIKGAE